MSNLGQMALFGRSYGPSKFCELALENGLCSHVPGRIGQKFLQHLFFSCFFGQDKIITRTIRLSSGTTDAVFSQN